MRVSFGYAVVHTRVRSTETTLEVEDDEYERGRGELERQVPERWVLFAIRVCPDVSR
jgi:hypothetical protein